MKNIKDFDPSLIENIPDLSSFYTDSVLTETAVLEDGNYQPEPVLMPTIGKLEERYSNFEQIAEGGQKNIYQVKDEYTARIIAMAIIRDKPAKRQSECNRFIQEARIAANLQHPNIVPIHDIGVTADGKPFFTMKLIRGENLGSIIHKIRDGFPQYQKKYDLTRLLTIYQKVCNAVRFSHSKGIIHLDLKPENVEVGDFGEVMVVDWGLAKLVKDDKNPKSK
ncbi:MAG: serine/threonine-protein kinase, partial [Lentisphaeria bacterium]